MKIAPHTASPPLTLGVLPQERVEVFHPHNRPTSDVVVTLGHNLYCDLYGNIVYTPAPLAPLPKDEVDLASQGTQSVIKPKSQPDGTIVDQREHLLVVDPPGPENTTVILMKGNELLVNPNGESTPPVHIPYHIADPSIRV